MEFILECAWVQMENIISEYQHWKQQGTTIRTQARQAMETRFKELLTEAAAIAQEYHTDFGAILKLPPTITSFKYKAGVKSKAKTGTKTKAAADKEPKGATPPAANVKPPAAPNPKTAPLEKKLAAAKKKLEAAKAAGTATRNLEDRIYELEDEIRLAT